MDPARDALTGAYALITHAISHFCEKTKFDLFRFGTLSMANTGLYDCCGTVDGEPRGCVRNRAVMFEHADEIRIVEADADGNVPLAMGYRYNVVPFSEDTMLRDCQFTPAIENLDVPSNTYVAVSVQGTLDLKV